MTLLAGVGAIKGGLGGGGESGETDKRINAGCVREYWNMGGWRKLAAAHL